MIKFIFAMIVFLSSSFAFAAEKYAVPFWLTEYPSGYELTADVALKGKLVPREDLTNSIECSLVKGQVIHPWAQKTNFNYMAVSEISLYEALVDLEEYDGEFKKGDLIEELSYISEGFCLYRKLGTTSTFEMMCFEYQKDKVQLLEAGGDSVELWFQASCQNGNEAWFNTIDFESQAKGSFKPANILDYGEVEEP